MVPWVGLGSVIFAFTCTFYFTAAKLIIIVRYNKMAEPGSNIDNQIFEHKIVNNFLPISFNICFGCPKEPF